MDRYKNDDRCFFCPYVFFHSSVLVLLDKWTGRSEFIEMRTGNNEKRDKKRSGLGKK